MSQKQNEARRRNSQKSTGPRTSEGKARSAMNALKSGIDAKSAVLPGESLEKFQNVIDSWHDRFQPADPAERVLVDSLARAEWLKERYFQIQAGIMLQALEEHAKYINQHFPAAHVYRRREATLGRLRTKADAIDRNF